jgi:DNA polymerase-3 subunit gamma/tau
MSYQVLARKWRPQNFRDMAGQTHVLQALVNALDHNRLHHAYLFTGTRGVGKTTIARILAKCLNCETGVSSQPCEQCSACKEITEGRFVDLIEIDAASHTGVDDVRDMIDNAQYMPSSGRFKVYLIDEVHMLSKPAFNALLKTLEEPPAHVKFLLATTDPQKLPVTVLSRCLQFNLKNLAPEKIAEYLKSILEKEMIPFDDGSLWLLARAADGSMRDALSLTDQAIAFGGEKIAENAVREMLGTMDRRLIHPIIDALIAGDTSAMLNAVAQLAEQNPDYSGALDELLSLLHRIAIVQAAPAVLDQAPDERERLLELAGNMTAEDVQLYYQIGLNSQRDLSFAPDMRAGFEMALLRMLAFKPQGIVSGGEKKKTELSKPPVAAIQSTAKPTAAKPIIATPTPVATKPTNPPPSDAQKLTADNWPTLWQRLPLAGVIRNTAAHCCLERIDGNNYHFTLNQEQAGLFDPSHAARLAETLSAFLNKTCAVFITTGTPSTATPHQVQQQKRALQQLEAEESFRNDANVLALLQQFEGEIATDTIAPFQKSIH